METERQKEVIVRFVGAEDVIQHIVPLKEKRAPILRSTSARQTVNKRVSYAKTSDVDESDSSETEEESQDLKPAEALFVHGDEVVGSDVFGFKTPKKSTQMAKIASELARVSSSKSSPKSCRTPKSAPPSELRSTLTPKSILKKTPVSKVKDQDKDIPQSGCRRSNRLTATTPLRLWKRNEEVEDSSSSDSASSSDSNDEEQQTETPISAKPSRNGTSSRNATPSKTTTPSRNATPSRTGTPRSRRCLELTPGFADGSPSVGATPSSKKPPAAKSRRKIAEDNVVKPDAVESYFDAQKAVPVTSDRTLSRLETPRMEPSEVADALRDVEFLYASEREGLFLEHKQMFNKWMYQLCQGYNILLHGLGSKRRLIEQFRLEMLLDFTHVVVNGYFPGLTIKMILNSVTEVLTGHLSSFSSLADQCDFIRTYLKHQEYRDIFLIIHNIDGVMLRSEKTQMTLSLLAQIEGFHIIASIDHINSPLLWDQTKACRFNWLWHDTTTFDNYTEETSYENSILVQQTGALLLSSLSHVMRSLTPNARGIFLLLAKYQLENKDNATYLGLAFPDLYQKCREAFLVNSELTLRTQLVEFRDHKLIRTKKAIDGVENVLILLDESTLTQYIEQQEGDQE